MRLRTICALALTYAILGMLMNSVGIVILQSIHHFGATKPMGSTLEACKDLSVVVASFLLAVHVASFGYRRALIAVLAAMAAACLLASTATGFLAMQLLFVATGLAFGVAKVATYSTIGLLARTPAEHASLTGTVEGVFMVGVLSGAWIFGWFVGADDAGNAWLRVYWLLAGLCVVSAGLWLTVRMDESAATAADGAAAGWGEMARLAVLPATIAVLVGLFLYVLIEQGVGTWLPTFNSEALHLSPAMSAQMSSIYLVALALGRLVSGAVLRRVPWLPVLLACLAGAGILVVAALPLAHGLGTARIDAWSDAPLAAYLFPMIGFFLAPIYPTICSVTLSGLARHRHPAMIGLIVVFSALGGTLGSFITGLLFQNLPGALAFYFVLPPIALLAIALVLVRRTHADSSRA
jgi:fucose permease